MPCSFNLSPRCTSLLFVAETNHQPRPNLGGNGVFSLQESGEPGRELQIGLWRQELKHKPRRKAAYRLAPSDLLHYLSYTSLDHLPRDDTHHSALGAPTLIRSLTHPSWTRMQASRI